MVCFRYVIVNTESTGGGGGGGGGDGGDCDDDNIRSMTQAVFCRSLNKEARVRSSVCP